MSKLRKKFLNHTAGKYCRLAGSNAKPKLVYDVEVYSQPSEIYGVVRIVYTDDSKESVGGRKKHIAALKDLECFSPQEYKSQHLTTAASDTANAPAKKGVEVEK